MENSIFNELLQRLTKIETKLDNIENMKKDVEDVRIEVSDLKSEVNLLKAKDEMQGREIKDLKDTNKWLTRTLIGELIGLGLAVLIGCIKMGIGV